VQCGNNLKQIGVAAQHYYSIHQNFPVGADWRESPSDTGAFWAWSRWSSLVYLSQFLEETNAYNQLDTSYPLYLTDTNITSPAGVAIVVPTFLCPSDLSQVVEEGYGPTNYVACSGSGINGGTPYNTDGIFYAASAIRLSQVTDGASHTALFSESILGIPTGPAHDPAVDYQYTTPPATSSVTQSLCNAAGRWNYTMGKGYGWVSGEIRCALYNHYYTPNSTSFDCVSTLMTVAPGPLLQQIKYTDFGWRAARSRHPAGVNLMMADGSVQFIVDEVDPSVWTGWSTRAGGEVLPPINP
jgi:prepilin-type processing-associated H-X9-DG protein